ncbi:carboxypeptidase regulatory-like domain-containing protein, partial [bacterium]|nr:carboxypeptidase regulatory-like domain-containing protein [bacterium]
MMKSKNHLICMVILCSILMAASAVCSYAVNTNLVINPSFSSFPDVGTQITINPTYLPGCWVMNCNGGYVEVADNDQGGDGKCIKLVRTNGTSGYNVTIQTYPWRNSGAIDIIPGHRYYVVYWAKSSTGNYVDFVIPTFDAGNNHITNSVDNSDYKAIPLTTQWGACIANFTAPSNAAICSIVFRPRDVGDVYIDSVQLYDLSTMTKNLYPDPTFASFIVGMNTTSYSANSFRFFGGGESGGSMQVVDSNNGFTAIKIARTSSSGDTGFDMGMEPYWVPDTYVPVQANHTYLLSYQARSDEGSQLGEAITGWDSSYHYLGDSWLINDLTSTWTKYSQLWTAAPLSGFTGEAYRANVSFRLRGTGSLEFGDVSMVDVTPSTLTGTVINGLTGQPVSEAAVKITSATQTFTTTTNASGVYTFSGIPFGMWNLVASANGYATWHSTSNPSDYDIFVSMTTTKDVALMPDTSNGSNSWTITDTFTRAANTDLGHTEDANAIPWVKTTGNTYSTINSDGKLRFDTGISACGASLGRGFTPADFDVSVDMVWDTNQLNSLWAGIAYRQTSVGTYNQGYFLNCPYTDGDGNATIELQYNGTKIGSAAIQTSYLWGNGVTLRLRASGDRHTVWVDGNKVMDVIDSQRTDGGYMGLFCDKDNIVYWDNLNVTPSSTTVAQSTPRIYYADFTTLAWGHPSKELYDIEHTVICVQGLANREAPRVFVRYPEYIGSSGQHFGADDNIWLARLTEPGGLCEGWPVETMRSVGDLVDRFRSIIRGVIVYDDSTGVLSTSLAATTAAACENAIAVRKDTSAGSMYNFLTVTKGLPVLIDLSGKFTGTGTIWGTNGVASTGSKKCDAYIWAKVNYLDTGKCDPTVLSYTLDEYGLINNNVAQVSQLANLDYAISKKGFCFDLSPWGGETPVDDRSQPVGTDRNTYIAILSACNAQTGGNKMIEFCGFPRWDCKYTNSGSSGGSHSASATECEFITLNTTYNAYVEATAPMPMWVCNSSFYHALKPEVMERRYVNNPAPTYDNMVTRGLITPSGTVPNGNYVMMGMGDYDGPAWILNQLGWDSQHTNSPIWEDSARGTVYCNWGLDPNLVDRASVAFDYFYRNKTDKDFFISWDAGAGYVFPQNLSTAIEPVWQAHCRNYFRMLDQSIIGWLNWTGYSSSDLPIYTPFSGDGIGSTCSQQLLNNVPCSRNGGDFGGYGTDVIDYATGVHFASYETCLWTPTEMKNLRDYWGTTNNHQFLDAYSFYYLLRYYLGGSNDYRATWVGDTIPRIMAKGQTYPVTVTVRNDGWDTWTTSGSYGLAYAIVNSGAAVANSNYDAHGRFQLPIGTSVAPGQTVTFTVNIVAPSTNGNYDLYYDMSKDGTTWFHEANNIEWKKQIIVATNVTDVDSDG